jgi:hypothetical protein
MRKVFPICVKVAVPTPIPAASFRSAVAVFWVGVVGWLMEAQPASSHGSRKTA